MNIKEKIEFWQSAFVSEYCCSQAETLESNKELELVLSAIDNLKNNGRQKFTQREALRIRSDASCCMLGDSGFMDIINREDK